MGQEFSPRAVSASVSVTVSGRHRGPSYTQNEVSSGRS